MGINRIKFHKDHKYLHNFREKRTATKAKVPTLVVKVVKVTIMQTELIIFKV
jgi:hypothetical protein